MALRIARRAFGILLLASSLVVITWGLRSTETLRQSTLLSSADMALPALGQAAGGSSEAVGILPALEPRQLDLSWPKSLRLGDGGTLRLTVGFPTSQSSDGSVRSASHQAYNLVLQSHLDLSGMKRTPTGEVSQVLLSDQPVVFIWYLRPSTSGEFRGKVWLHLRIVPRATGQEERILLAAQQVDIEVTTLLGMSGSQARLFGSLGLAASLPLLLEGFLSRSLEWVAQRKKGHQP